MAGHGQTSAIGDEQKPDAAGEEQKSVAGDKQKSEVAGDKQKSCLAVDKQKSELAVDKQKSEVALEEQKSVSKLDGDAGEPQQKRAKKLHSTLEALLQQNREAAGLVVQEQPPPSQQVLPADGKAGQGQPPPVKPGKKQEKEHKTVALAKASAVAGKAAAGKPKKERGCLVSAIHQSQNVL